MYKLSEEDVKKYLVDILVAFDKFCNDNNLEYSLFAGTLLGAVRHNGFIPWDDDVDVCMPYADYWKMIELTKNNPIIESDYEFLCHENIFDYLYPFGKLKYKKSHKKEEGIDKNIDVGINIDIFPLYPIKGDTFDEAKKSRMIAYRYEGWMGNSLFTHYPRHDKNIFIHLLKCIRHFFIRLKSFDYYFNKQKQYFISNIDKECTYVAFPWGTKSSFYELKFMKEYIYHTFEGKKFKVFKNFEYILKTMYGNYMQLPPIEEQKGGHNVDVYIEDDRD